METSWESTQLWRRTVDAEAKGPRGKQVTLALQQTMPVVERVLASGGTMPLDFTLHDADHSFRVAERMADLIGDYENALSP